MARLLETPGLLTTMGRKARHNMEGRGYEQAFIDTWEMYKQAS